MTGFLYLAWLAPLAFTQPTIDLVKTITQYSNPPGLAAGTPAGSYAISEAEAIDHFSGRLNFTLPLLRVGGRGSAGYAISLKIPSRWEASVQTHCDVTQNFGSVCTPEIYDATFGSYQAVMVEYGPGVLLKRSSGLFGSCLFLGTNQQEYRMTSTRTSFVFVDSTGTEHELFDTSLHGGQHVGPPSPSECAERAVMPNRGMIFASRDGSAMTFVADSAVSDEAKLGNFEGSAGRLYFADGTMYRIDGGKTTYIRDRFGNLTTFEYATSHPNELQKIVDPEGREITFAYSQTADTITFPKLGGGTQSVTVGFSPLASQLRSDFATAGLQTPHELFDAVTDRCALNGSPRTECLVNPSLPSYVTLPNSKQYQFRYNAHAELAEVLLPTGGRVEYDWGGGGAVANPDGYLGFEDLALIYRVVNQRRSYLSETGGSAVETTYYSPGTLGSGASREVAHGLNSLNAPKTILHWFYSSPVQSSFLQPGHEPFWNHGKEHTTSILGSGTTLRTTSNEWIQTSALTPVIRSTTTKVPRASGGELWAKTEHQYDQFTNITETTETDWGAGVPGSIVRKKTTTYVANPDYTHAAETNPANYVVHLRRLPLMERSFKVVSGTSTEEARREYGYDDQSAQPVQPCSGLSRHDTNLPFSGAQLAQYLADNPVRRNTSYTRFGNVTTVTDWTSGSASVSAHARYDIAGNVVRTQDPNQTVATAAYSGACAYPSQVTIEAVPQNFVSTMTWDASTGKLLTLTDAANVATHFGYEAALGRMTLRTAGANTADADPVAIVYDDNALTVTTSQEIDSQIAHKQSSKEYDGLGRLVWERQKTNGSDIVVKTEYDALGRVRRRSIPAASPAQWETFEYDALDRIITRIWHEGEQPETVDAREITQYQVSDITGLNAHQTKVTDAAGKWRVMANDALGRLIQVREPNPNNPASPLDTYYTYNSLDNLLTVNQAGRTRSFTYDWMGRLLTAFNPESGTTNYTYDGNGNLTAKSDARSITTTITYDKLSRPLTKTYTGGATPTVTYAYNGLRLSSVATSDSIAQSFTYRPSGRIDTSTQTVGGVPYSFAYTYYKDGSLKSVTYPSGRLIEYPSLDRAGRVLKVQGTLAGTTTEYARSVSYNDSGQMSSLTFGNDLIERWDYNPRRLQPWQIRLGTATVDDARGRWQFGYCAGLNYNQDCATNNGNVMHQRILPLNIYQTFAYDTLNRISLFEEKATSAAPACAAGGATPCRAYGYDNWSNQFVSQANVVTRHSFTPAAASNFDAANRLIIQGSTYDPAGNQTGIGGYTFTYDAENRLKTSKLGEITTTYAYDGEGRRVKKGNEIYVYDAFGNLAAEYGGTPLAEGGPRYLTTDHLGSTRLITKADGAVDQRIDYLPFGKAIPNGVSGRATGQGYQTNNYLDPLKPGFTGKDRDGETGLDYFLARYYAAAQGRFTNPDPMLGSASPLVPQSWNRYAYTLNNPLRYSDPFGLYEWDVTLGGSAKDDELRKQLSKRAANKIIDRRNDIRKAIAKGVGSSDADVSGAYQAYGAEGAANGVRVASQKPKEGGVGSASQQLEYVDGSFRSLATVSIDPKQSGNDLFITLAHEGSHVRDGQAYAKAAGRLGDVPALVPFNLTILQTEINAYSTSVNAARMLGLRNLNYAVGSQTYQIWRSGTASVDRDVLENFLRASPMYAPKLSNLMFPR